MIHSFIAKQFFAFAVFCSVQYVQNVEWGSKQVLVEVLMFVQDVHNDRGMQKGVLKGIRCLKHDFIMMFDR